MLNRAIIAVVTLASLAACGGPSLSDDQRAEVENIAEDFADGAASSVDTSALAQKIEQLESEIAHQDKSDDATYTYAKAVSNELDSLRDQYNEHLRDHHGAR
jgi:flagellar biosynthesis chaperone FliJ